MAEKNIVQEFRLKDADKTRNCFVEEIKQSRVGESIYVY